MTDDAMMTEQTQAPEPCDHNWNTTSNLRLVVEMDRDREALANIFPMAPKLYPVAYCRICGALRVAPDESW